MLRNSVHFQRAKLTIRLLFIGVLLYLIEYINCITYSELLKLEIIEDSVLTALDHAKPFCLS